MLVYKYGLRPPCENVELVEKQLRLAWEYRRDLTKLIAKRRMAVRALQDSIKEEKQVFMAAAEKLKLLEQQLKAVRARTRSRSETTELSTAVRTARAEKTQAKQVLASKSKEVYDENAVDLINEQWLADRRALRAEYSKRGLYWGTYQLVEASAGQADKTTKLWDKHGKPQDPGVPRWDGTGRVGVQVQGGITVPLLYVCQDTRVRLYREPDMMLCKHLNKKGKWVGGGKNRATFGRIALRIGSNPDRSPVWAEWPITLHRPLPHDCVVKQLAVSFNRKGPIDMWTIEITIDDQDTKREHCGVGVVAVDLGWRQVQEEQEAQLRAFFWRDEHGNSGEFRLSEALLRALRYPNKLRSIRDQHRDAMVPELLALLPEELPEWLRAKTVRRGDKVPSSAQARVWLSQWKSFRRWSILARSPEWGTECPLVLQEWWRKDRHLWEWEECQRAKALNRRRNELREWAAWLTRTYGTLVLESDDEQEKAFDLRPMVEKANPEDEAENKKARSNRHIGAPGLMRLDLVNAAKARGCEIALVPARKSTQECPFDDCRHVEVWDAAKSIEKKPPCSNCGRVWDQDDGACVVLLRRYREQYSGDEAVVDASATEEPEKKESAHVRMRKQRAAKEARMEAARKGNGNGPEPMAI